DQIVTAGGEGRNVNGRCGGSRTQNQLSLQRSACGDRRSIERDQSAPDGAVAIRTLAVQLHGVGDAVDDCLELAPARDLSLRKNFIEGELVSPQPGTTGRLH